MENRIGIIRAAIESRRQELLNHPLYKSIHTIEDLQFFMQFHVYAVWDFMSLLKALQSSLTCVSIPWFPVGDANTRYLINEIVTGEESDVDEDGMRMSHFELYLKAMQQAGADTAPVSHLLQLMRDGHTIEGAVQTAAIPAAAKQFISTTFDVIASSQTHVMAAVFTFGREDLIPGMFMSIIRDLEQSLPDRISTFRYYLERHIEVDGDHHSHLALAMTARLCDEDDQKWEEALVAVKKALDARKILWDGAYSFIMERKKVMA